MLTIGANHQIEPALPRMFQVNPDTIGLFVKGDYLIAKDAFSTTPDSLKQ